MPSGSISEAHFTCLRNECVQARAEIIELKSEVRDLTRDKELAEREVEENSFWVDNQMTLMRCVDKLQEDNDALKRFLQ